MSYRFRLLAVATAGAMLAAGTVAAQRQDRLGSDSALATKAVQTISYGPDKLQQLDYYPAAGSSRAPLVVFVHGGGWKRGDKAMMRGSDKLSHWRAQGYAVASLNYRLVPDATVEDQASDVASALATLKRQASSLGFEPDRIALVGHSAGAHLVALVGTDPQWLTKAGLSFGAVRGILPLDGAGYHVPSQMNENQRLLGDTYQQAFGMEHERQLALSPTHHAAAPNASRFLIMHVEGRPDAKRQSEGLARSLRQAGTAVELQSVPGRGLKGHMEINRRLGEPGYPATPIVDAWLAKLFAG
jgi:arylformamidase